MINRSLPPEQRRDIEEFQRLIAQLQRKAKRNYERAGQPFGPTPRGRDLWTLFNQKTTVN